VSSTGSMRSPTSKGNMTKTVHKMEMWRNIIHIYMYIYSVCNMIGICIYSTKNHLVIPTFPCFSHLSQQGHALIHRHQTGRFRCRGRRCLSPLQPALGVEGHRSQSSRGGQRRQASDAKNVAPWEHLGRKWRKFTVFFGCVSGFSLVFSGLFSKLRKAISWSFLILSPLGTGRNDKNIVGKWWMYVGQEPCKKKLPSGNLMSSYEGFFGDVRCESLFPFESMLSVKALATIAATDWQRPLTFLALKCRVQIFTASKRNGDPVVTDAASPILTIRISACKDQREKTRHGFWKKNITFRGIGRLQIPTAKFSGWGPRHRHHPASRTCRPGRCGHTVLSLRRRHKMSIWDAFWMTGLKFWAHTWSKMCCIHLRGGFGRRICNTAQLSYPNSPHKIADVLQ
jgi:hypothetical protein